MSISQLTKSLNCVVFFYPKFCFFFKDLTTKTLIGMNEERDGLYYFKPVKPLLYKLWGMFLVRCGIDALVTPPFIMFLILFLVLKPWIFVIVVPMGSILVYLLNKSYVPFE